MQVTIGIPFFNAEEYLEGAIRSIFAQSHTDWELILMDDGSTDRSLEIAQAVDDPRVRVFSDGNNKKLAARLNEIVELANYDFIMRMDADDLCSPDRLERQLKVLTENPEIDIVSSGLISMSDEFDVLGARWHYETTITRAQLLRKKGSGIVHAAVLGRRKWFQRNPYDPTVPIAQDYDLWLRSSRKSDLSVHIIQAPLYYVREANSVTMKKLLKSYGIDRKAIIKNRRHVGDLRFVIKSYIKSLVLIVIVMTGNIDWLIRRRNKQDIPENLLTTFYANLKIIQNTFVKGL